MMNDNEPYSDTERKILDAAQAVFLKKGLAGARMQEIADAASINKALLHYYFRSKDKLFMEIVKSHIGDFFPKIFYIWMEDLDFDKKVKKFVSEYISFFINNPDLPWFFINVVHQNPEMILSIIKIANIPNMDNLQKQLNAEAGKGVIKKVEAHNFLLTLISLCIFPLIASPLLKLTFEFSDDEFSKIMEERKKIVSQIILSWLNFKKEKK